MQQILVQSEIFPTKFHIIQGYSNKNTNLPEGSPKCPFNYHLNNLLNPVILIRQNENNID
jgi:hypothetical protein